MSLPTEEQKLDLKGIPLPPDDIFKFRGRNRTNMSQEVWGVGGTVSYIPERADYVDGKGNFVHYAGFKGDMNGQKVDLPAPLFPSKCVAPVHTIYALAGPKRMIRNTIAFLSSMHKAGRINRFFDLYNDACELALTPFFLKSGYYSPVAKELALLTESLLKEFWVTEEVAKRTGEIVAMFVEHDNAYRLRVQDFAGETNIEQLLLNLPKELQRLIAIQATREVVQGGGQQVVDRFKSGARLFKWAWMLPPLRRKIRRALSKINIKNMELDEADFYHALLYGDYNARGKTQDERLAIYATYHGPDQAKWPPRILIRHQGNQWG